MGDWALEDGNVGVLEQSVSLSSAGSFANGSIVEVFPSFEADVIALHLRSLPGADGVNQVGYTTLMIGPAGSEVPIIQTIYQTCNYQGTNNFVSSLGYWPLSLPKSTRLSAYTQINVSGVNSLYVLPVFGTLRRSQQITGYEVGSVAFYSPTTSAPVGAWVEAVAATSFTWRWVNLITGTIPTGGIAEGWDMQIGIGPAGSEVVITTSAKIQKALGGCNPHTVNACNACYIPKGTRVSVRMVWTGGNGTPFSIGMVVYGGG